MEKSVKRKTYIFGSNRKGVNLSEVDLELLELLYEQRVLTSYQLQDYARALYNVQPHTLRVKFKKWADYKLVIPEIFKLGQNGFYFLYYRIGKRGRDILMNEGIVPDEVITEKSITKPSDTHLEHLFGTQQVVNQARIRLKKANKPYQSIYPFKSSYLGNVINDEVVVPDWIMKSEYSTLHIEMDTGKEKLDILRNKIRNYHIFANSFPDEQHSVLFSVLDDSITNRNNYGEERYKRVGGIKDTYLIPKDSPASNLNFYSATLTNSGTLTYQVLTGDYPISAIERSNTIMYVNDIWTVFNNRFNYELEPILPSDVYMAYVNERTYADGIYLFKELKSGKEKLALYVIMETGNMGDLDRLKMLNHIQQKNEFKKGVDYIFAIYRTQEEMETDVIGELLEHVLFGNIEEWTPEPDKWPIFYRTVSSYVKESVRLDEI